MKHRQNHQQKGKREQEVGDDQLRSEPPPQSQHPAKFREHKSYESGDTTLLICH